MACIFCRIVAGDLPAETLHRDERVVAFRDIHPQAPCHVLVVPREHVADLSDLEDPEVAAALLLAAGRIAREEGLDGGWRLIANAGEDGGQEVDHLHLHVLGGRPLGRMLPSAGA